jgi:ribonuclease HI
VNQKGFSGRKTSAWGTFFVSSGGAMAKKKFYAVRKGKTEGIFETWDACRAVVEGYPCAEYKSFSTYEEAMAYLNRNIPAGREQIPEQEKGQVTAYVDGSFDEKIGKYSFGCVLILPDGEIVRESGNGDNPESMALRNVTGEMLGAMFAVKWCMVNQFFSVKICYDYSGIEMWATGQWKTKTNLTKKYADYMRSNMTKIEIIFQKVKAHTGNKYNEEADQLAKKALTDGNGIPKIKNMN